MVEASKGGRIWWCTFTVKPELQYLAEVNAVAHAKHNLEKDFWLLPPEKQFALRVRFTRKYITLMLKRLRKGLKTGYRNTNIVGLNGIPLSEEIPTNKFRYVIVAEPHKSGLPHYHALIFEGDNEIKKGWLKHFASRVGLSSMELINEPKGAMRYITGYLSKSPISVISASLRFGQLIKIDKPSSF